MRQLDTFVDIDAPAARVWQVLTDLPRYRDWNPFIVQIDGTCRTGERVAVQMHIPGKGFQRYKVQLTSVDAPRVFAWLGHFHVRGLIDGDHAFELSARPQGGVRLRQRENFSGLLVPFVWAGFIQRHLLPCFEALNRNLKAYCEGQPLPVALPPSPSH